MTEANEDVVRFTAKELLARLDVKLDELGKRVEERHAILESRIADLEKRNEARGYVFESFKDHESRLRSLERKIWILAGAATTAGGTASAVAQILIGG